MNIVIEKIDNSNKEDKNIQKSNCCYVDNEVFKVSLFPEGTEYRSLGLYLCKKCVSEIYSKINI